ncbi:Bifunctional polymyxin resistance protein ArnA [Caloramator mitchellensis]|uniref:Bifunctional polymyxin resistance protein ArnA n=1 Tax=Caloramator mitchellensis TaxID=908809 RepID=A0A0R3JQX5_CALMK|nr:formyltransferase family protein [Caloramator mitchellensis]KRQ85867.1 Bifunctional polymyxin resistance protein ArnA [Caloramator mitchellensis]
MLKVIILTQQDRFFIPNNIQKIIDNSEVLEIVNVDCKSSLQNKLSDFIKWFGLYQVAKLGIFTILRSLAGRLDKLFSYKLYDGLCGVEHIAKKNNIPFKVIHDSNSKDFFNVVKELNPDVILSFSAPQVIKEPLLSFPKYGILNVHGSLLPDYRGCMPSFWYLYNKEEYGGATVHYMSEKIDDGDIVAQDKIYIGDCKSMFELMKRTKKVGGELMVRVIKELESGSLKRRPNNASEGRYFTWPNAEQGKEFRAKGKRLI